MLPVLEGRRGRPGDDEVLDECGAAVGVVRVIEANRRLDDADGTAVGAFDTRHDTIDASF